MRIPASMCLPMWLIRPSHVWLLVLAGSVGTAVSAADREIKVDDRLDASAETLTNMMRADDRAYGKRIQTVCLAAR